MGEAKRRGNRAARVQEAILQKRGKAIRGDLNLQKKGLIGLGALTLWLVQCAAYETQTILERKNENIHSSDAIPTVSGGSSKFAQDN